MLGLALAGAVERQVMHAGVGDPLLGFGGEGPAEGAEVIAGVRGAPWFAALLLRNMIAGRQAPLD